MNSLPSIILLLLAISLVHSQPITADNRNDLSTITWTNSLATEEDLNNFLSETDTHGIAREVLSLKRTSKRTKTGKVVVMGPETSTLTLDKCLKEMKLKRNNKKLFLEVPSKEIFTEAVKLLTPSTTDGDWITLNLHVFKGPNGNEPEFPLEKMSSEVLAKWPANVRKCFGMTIGYEGKEVGYTQAVLDRMEEDWATAGLDKVKDFDFSIDVYHLSKTEEKQQDRLSELLHGVTRREFWMGQEKQEDVNVYRFNAFLEENAIDMEQSYLNVPDQLRRDLRQATGEPEVETTENVPEAPTSGDNPEPAPDTEGPTEENPTTTTDAGALMHQTMKVGIFIGAIVIGML